MYEDDTLWQELICGVRAGDESACNRLWNDYGPRMERLARRNISREVQARADADDVVQSACRTFFRRAQGGEFNLPDARSLWLLLCTITLNKVRQNERHHRAQKRYDPGQRSLDARDASGERLSAEPTHQGWTPDEEIAFTDQLQQIIDSMSPEERMVLDLKLQQCSNTEIKERLGRSERTVSRILQRIRDRLGNMLDEE